MPEHHVKAEQRQLQPRAGPDRLLVRPVDLGLMTRRGLEALLLPPRWPWPGALDVAAARFVAALDPSVPDQVLMDPRRQKPRGRGQPLIDQRLELVQLRRHPPAPVDRLRAGLQIPL